MPLYEMSVIVRRMSKKGLVTTVKRVAETILDQGGYVRKIDSLGTQDLPYKMLAHGRLHTKGSYFLLHFDAPPTTIDIINDNCIRDVDLVRPVVFKIEPPPKFECTRHDELKPPVFRPEVQKMISEANKRIHIEQKKKFKMNTGLDYCPFN